MPAESTERTFHIALYRTDGNRRNRHRVVLYLGVDCDWSDIQRSRNGNQSWGILATAPETTEVVEYRAAEHRAASLQYSGVSPANLSGLEKDLVVFGYDNHIVNKFVDAARKFFV